jgi:DNA invertase Pin-like site-specific DNA recombinase
MPSDAVCAPAPAQRKAFDPLRSSVRKGWPNLPGKAGRFCPETLANSGRKGWPRRGAMSAKEEQSPTRRRAGTRPFPSGHHRTIDLLVPASSETRAVALYAWRQKSQSAEAELEALRAHCRRRGLRVAEEFLEVDAGAARPARDALLAAVRSGRVQAIAAQRLGLLARSPRELAALTHELEERDIDLLVLDPAIDTSTDTGRLAFRVISCVAELDRERVAALTRAGLDAARGRGRRLGRPAAQIPLQRAEEMLRAGTPVAQIARRLHVSRSSLRRALARREAAEPA